MRDTEIGEFWKFWKFLEVEMLEKWTLALIIQERNSHFHILKRSYDYESITETWEVNILSNFKIFGSRKFF
jgi:hypothetical protein